MDQEGITKKKLEKESGARILIRGKGSCKEGRTEKHEDSEDDLHVLITADTRKQLKRAARMVKKILVPIEENKNMLKIQQLIELAKINGTWRDQNRLQPRTWKSADVYCKHCGEISHPTSDCPLKARPVDKTLIEREYLNFMNEIGDVNEMDVATLEIENSYHQFMDYLKAKPNTDSYPVPMPAPRHWLGNSVYSAPSVGWAHPANWTQPLLTNY